MGRVRFLDDDQGRHESAEALDLATVRPVGDGVATSDIGERQQLLLMDARPLRRASVLHLLEDCAHDYDIVSVAHLDDLDKADDERAGLLVFSIGSDAVTDTDVKAEMGAIAARFEHVPLVLISDRDDTDDVVAAFRCGIRGYLPTTLEPTIASIALQLVQAGGTFVPNSLIAAFDAGPCAAAPQARHGGGGVEGLTPRQWQVLNLLIEAKANKVIAKELDMQESTVKVHVRHIMRKLGANNRTDAALRAVQILQDREIAPAAE